MEGASHFTTFDIIDPPAGRILRSAKDFWVWCVDGNPKKTVFYIGRDGKSMALQGNKNGFMANRLPAPPIDNIQWVFVEKVFFTPAENEMESM